MTKPAVKQLKNKPNKSRKISATNDDKNVETFDTDSDDDDDDDGGFVAEIRIGSNYQAKLQKMLSDENKASIGTAEYDGSELLWSPEKDLEDKVDEVLSCIAERDRLNSLSVGTLVIVTTGNDTNRKYCTITKIVTNEEEGELLRIICTVFNGVEHTDVNAGDCVAADPFFRERIQEVVHESYCKDGNGSDDYETFVDYAMAMEEKALKNHINSGGLAQELAGIKRAKLDVEYAEWTYDEICTFCVAIAVQRRGYYNTENRTNLVKIDDVELDLIKVWKDRKLKRSLKEILDMYHRVLLSMCHGNMLALQKIYSVREACMSDEPYEPIVRKKGR